MAYQTDELKKFGSELVDKFSENVLWNELGTKKEYEAEYGKKPLGEFVREIVGLDMAALSTCLPISTCGSGYAELST